MIFPGRVRTPRILGPFVRVHTTPAVMFMSSTPDNLYIRNMVSFPLSLSQNSINGVSYGIDVLDDAVVVVENKYDMPPNNRAFRSMAGGPSTKTSQP